LTVKKREFLKGRKFGCDQNESVIHGIENVINCKFKCNLRCEKEDKFIFRFKRKRRKCDQLNAFEEFFTFSKKTIVKWRNVEKSMLEKFMKNICTESVVKNAVNITQNEEITREKEFQDRLFDMFRVELFKMVMLFKGELDVQSCCYQSSEGERESSNGQGYILFLSKNSREVHCKSGFCWRKLLESLAEMDISLTGDVVHLCDANLIRAKKVMLVSFITIPSMVDMIFEYVKKER
jgi:hypothetical protein